jgi:hypothetical protein
MTGKVKESGSVGIAFRVSKTPNELLNKAIERSKRTKKSEAKMRLEDHLRRFVSITEIGQTTNRK